MSLATRLRQRGIHYGWIVAAVATAAYGAGALRTALGGYVEAFTIAGALCFVAAGLVLGIGRRGSLQGIPAAQPVTAPSFN